MEDTMHTNEDVQEEVTPAEDALEEVTPDAPVEPEVTEEAAPVEPEAPVNVPYQQPDLPGTPCPQCKGEGLDARNQLCANCSGTGRII